MLKFQEILTVNKQNEGTKSENLQNKPKNMVMLIKWSNVNYRLKN